VGGEVYKEVHHITPKHSGGDNSGENLVVVLPEEHLFLHQLRYKAYNHRGDMLAVRFIINGFNNNKTKNVKFYNINKRIRSGVVWIKQNSYEFRKVHGWQTKDGVRRISEARKNKIVVKDNITGEMIGSVSDNHEKVLSGEWVHHSKGYLSVFYNGEKIRITSEEYQKNKKEMGYMPVNGSNEGSSNSNYSGVTDDEIVKIGTELIYKLGVIPSYCGIVLYARYKGINMPKSLSKMRFKGQGVKFYMNLLSDITNIKYEPYRKNKINIKDMIKEKKL